MRTVWRLATAASISLPLALAFRDDLWRPLFGRDVATVTELAELLTAAAAVSALVAAASVAVSLLRTVR